MDEHLRARPKRIIMHFDGCRPIFQRIAFADGLSGQLALFPDGDKGNSQLYGEHWPEKKAPAINAYDCVKRAIAQPLNECVDDVLAQLRVFEYGGNVLKDDAGFRKVGNIPNGCFQLLFYHQKLSNMGQSYAKIPRRE